MCLMRPVKKELSVSECVVQKSMHSEILFVNCYKSPLLLKKKGEVKLCRVHTVGWDTLQP